MSSFPDTPVTLLSKLAVQLTGQRDEFAWVRLFELYEPAIRRFAKYQGAAGDSEDIAQEVFIKLISVLRSGRYSAESGKFRTYIATMIKNEIINRWRKKSVRPEGCQISIDDPDHPVNIMVPSEVDETIEAQWRLARREAAVEHVLTKTALSKQTKDIYKAHVIDEMPIGDIVEKFGVKENYIYQIKNRVGRMIAAIEEEFEK